MQIWPKNITTPSWNYCTPTASTVARTLYTVKLYNSGTAKNAFDFEFDNDAHETPSTLASKQRPHYDCFEHEFCRLGTILCDDAAQVLHL